MAVMGFDRMYLAVLVLNRGFYEFVIERDEEEISSLAAAEGEFWDRLQREEPPELDGSDATMTALKQLYPEEDSGLELTLPSDTASELKQFQHIQEAITDLQSERDAIKARTMARMGEAALAVAQDMTCSWVTRRRTSVDTAALKKEFPEIYRKYLKTTEYRVLWVRARKD